MRTHPGPPKGRERGVEEFGYMKEWRSERSERSGDNTRRGRRRRRRRRREKRKGKNLNINIH